MSGGRPPYNNGFLNWYKLIWVIKYDWWLIGDALVMSHKILDLNPPNRIAKTTFGGEQWFYRIEGIQIGLNQERLD